MNKVRGIVWVPLLIMIGAVLAFTVMAFIVYNWNHVTTTSLPNPDANTAVVTNLNTNTANTNASANTNTSAVIPSNWKTYTNTKLSFSLQYPPTWEIAEKENTVTISDKSNLGTAIDEEGIYYSTPRIVIQTQKDLFPKDVCLINQTSVVAAGSDRVRQTEGCAYAGATVATFFDQKNGFLAFSWTTDVQEQYPTYEQILSTFQLTNVTAAPANWKTYTNTKIDYSIKLPDSWNPISEFDGRLLPLHADTEMSSFQQTENSSPDISLIIQACTKIAPFNCAQHSLAKWKTLSGFTALNDPAYAVQGFEVGRDSDGTLDYLIENQAYYLYAYISKGAELNVQTILSTFQFTSVAAIPSDWKTYRNEEMGFSLQYPNDWTLSTENKETPGNSFNAVFHPVDISKQYNIQVGHTYLNYDNKGIESQYTVIKNDFHSELDYKELPTQNGISITAKELGSTLVPSALFATGRYIFVLDYHLADANDQSSQTSYEKDKTIFNQVVSTFRSL